MAMIEYLFETVRATLGVLYIGVESIKTLMNEGIHRIKAAYQQIGFWSQHTSDTSTLRNAKGCHGFQIAIVFITVDVLGSALS